MYRILIGGNLDRQGRGHRGQLYAPGARRSMRKVKQPAVVLFT
jgi:hypothetical protein